MIFDIIVLVILIVPMVKGFAKGFLHVFLHTLGWIGSLVAGFFLTRPLTGILNDGFLGDTISQELTNKFSESTDAINLAVDGLPSIISGGIKVTAESASGMFVEMLTTMLVSIISFLLIVFLVKLLIGWLIRSVLKRKKSKTVDAVDKILGLFAGFLEGIIIVFILLALLVPLMNLVNTDMTSSIVSGLDNSFIVGSLYDSNLLLLVTGGFFS